MKRAKACTLENGTTLSLPASALLSSEDLLTILTIVDDVQLRTLLVSSVADIIGHFFFMSMFALLLASTRGGLCCPQKCLLNAMF